MKTYFLATALLLFLGNFAMETDEYYNEDTRSQKMETMEIYEPSQSNAITIEKCHKPLRRTSYIVAGFGIFATAISGTYIACAAFLNKEPELSPIGFGMTIVGLGLSAVLIRLARKELPDIQEPFIE